MTLRARLTAMLLVTLVPLGAAVGLGLYAFVRVTLTARLDDALAARADALAAAVRASGDQVEFDAEDATAPQYLSPPGEGAAAQRRQTAYFELWQIGNGLPDQLIERSASLGTARLVVQGGAGTTLDGTWNAELPHHVDVRVLARRVTPVAEEHDGASAEGRVDRAAGGDASAAPASRDGAPQVLVVVAVSREPLDDPLQALAVGLTCAGLVLVVVGTVAVRWSLARGLAPVGILAQRVSAIDVAHLGAGHVGPRLDATDLPAEIAPIQDRLGELLGRIDAAMQREKRFTAAASHELRTPVAELRALLEVAASRPRSAEEAHGVITRSLASIERLDNLVGGLLRLARIESGRERAAPTTVRIAEVVRAAIEAARPTAGARRVNFVSAVPGEAAALAEERLLLLGVTNLIANAAEYADQASTVEVRVEETSSSVILRISNAATALAATDTGRLGEPLWRPDAARTASSHLGLGIPLARAALAACGAVFELRHFPEGGGRVTVDIHLKCPPSEA
ncbi:MAG: histidine kinase dimerization/phospho-acceptor domain-containing protein [Phycisphaerales bacterium]